MIQITNGKTHDIIATMEAEASTETATGDISTAIESAMDLFEAYVAPKVVVEFIERDNTYIRVHLKNKTRDIVHSVTLKIDYYYKGELVHSQNSTADIDMAPGAMVTKNIKRDKKARSVNKTYQVECEVVEYR